jgi:hypothetical protein
MAAVFQIIYFLYWLLNAWMIPKSEGCSWLVHFSGRNTTLLVLKNVFIGWAAHLQMKSKILWFLAPSFVSSHVRGVPCHHGMAHPQVADGGDALQLWRGAVNILNKQSRTADKGWSSSLGVWRWTNNSSQ